MSNPTIFNAIRDAVALDLSLATQENEAYKAWRKVSESTETTALDALMGFASQHDLTKMDIEEYCTHFAEEKVKAGLATENSIKAQKSQRKLILEFRHGFRVGKDGRMYEAAKAEQFILNNQEEFAGISAMAGAINAELKDKKATKTDPEKLAKAFVEKMTKESITMTKAIELIKKQYNASKD